MTAGASERVRLTFRRGLGSYAENAVVQAAVAQDLVDDLAARAGEGPFARVFEFGCGTGFLTRALLARTRAKTYVVNDLVAEARAHVAPDLERGAEAWDFVAGDIESLPIPGGCDLIASASTMQWVGDTAGLLGRLGEALVPGGWLALASYGPRHFHELHLLGGGGAAMSYHDAAAWRAMMPAGLSLVAVAGEERRLGFASPRALLRHLRLTGVNGAARGHWSRAELAAFEAACLRSCGDGAGGVGLTYAPLRILARKARV